jgi:Protein of unknown function (DUF2478)
MFNDLGSGSAACYLESAGVLAAAERVQEDIATSCDLVVLNECGKLEAASGGLRDAFAHTDAGKALSFTAAGPVNARRWRLPGMQTRDLRLLKTLKTATVASTPLAIW